MTANILWHIWKARNKGIFEQQRSEAQDIVLRAHQEWLEYEEARQQEGVKKANKRAVRQEEQVKVLAVGGVI